MEKEPFHAEPNDCFVRFDGCVYALKKTKRPIKGSQDENSAIKEVCAHAVLGKHKHVVRYYSAWCENDRMLIQSGTFFSFSCFSNKE